MNTDENHEVGVKRYEDLLAERAELEKSIAAARNDALTGAQQGKRKFLS